MLIPSKHEALNKNILVIGADLIKLLKKRTFNVETLLQDVKSNRSININQFFDTLTFLWCADIIVVDGFNVSLKQENVTA